MGQSVERGVEGPNHSYCPYLLALSKRKLLEPVNRRFQMNNYLKPNEIRFKQLLFSIDGPVLWQMPER